jgi:hypothetical protein
MRLWLRLKVRGAEMSELSYLEKLLDGVEVEWEKVLVSCGKWFVKSEFWKVFHVHYGEMYTHYGISA